MIYCLKLLRETRYTLHQGTASQVIVVVEEVIHKGNEYALKIILSRL